MWLLSLVASCRLLRCRVSTRSLESTVHGLFVPWTIRTIDGLFVPWTVHTVDCSYLPGLLVHSLDFSYPGQFVLWTVRTLLDCRTMDWSYRPWTFRTLDSSHRRLIVPSWTVRTMDCWLTDGTVHGTNSPGGYEQSTVQTVKGKNSPSNVRIVQGTNSPRYEKSRYRVNYLVSKGCTAQYQPLQTSITTCPPPSSTERSINCLVVLYGQQVINSDFNWCSGE